MTSPGRSPGAEEKGGAFTALRGEGRLGCGEWGGSSYRLTAEGRRLDHGDTDVSPAKGAEDRLNE
ncbi:hypothetical protein GCM10009654_29850 [Streptomyces hebeiensis]|uniref:Uncharacterized protein n=1 Tax=Streptomyces hebeiensis TaxID=229486 RepID=A0ABN1UV04_9ACTN